MLNVRISFLPATAFHPPNDRNDKRPLPATSCFLRPLNCNRSCLATTTTPRPVLYLALVRQPQAQIICPQPRLSFRRHLLLRLRRKRQRRAKRQRKTCRRPRIATRMQPVQPVQAQEQPQPQCCPIPCLRLSLQLQLHLHRPHQIRLRRPSPSPAHIHCQTRLTSPPSATVTHIRPPSPHQLNPIYRPSVPLHHP